MSCIKPQKCKILIIDIFPVSHYVETQQIEVKLSYFGRLIKFSVMVVAKTVINMLDAHTWLKGPCSEVVGCHLSVSPEFANFASNY